MRNLWAVRSHHDGGAAGRPAFLHCILQGNGCSLMAYTCPRCSRTSYHPRDEQERFCAACNTFEDDATREMHSICVMVELRTDNPLLDPDRIDVSSAEAMRTLRKAVVDSLPDLVGIVMVLPTETAKLMTYAHEEAVKASGLADLPKRPPAGYEPPSSR